MRRPSHGDVRDLLDGRGGGWSRTQPMTVRKAVEYGLPLTLRQVMTLEAALDEGVEVVVYATDFGSGEIVWGVRVPEKDVSRELRAALLEIGFVKLRYGGSLSLSLAPDGTVM